jgi:XTP/dITP diphosphohydrolase
MSQPAVLVIATHNRKKAGEMVQILSARFPQIELRTLADYEGAPEPEETGTTYVENARIKSESAARFTGEWSLADDAGLEIDALDGAPGLYSKRFGGEDLPFPQKIQKILDLLADIPQESRGARFRCCVSLSVPGGDGQSLETTGFEATCEGSIATEPSGNGGFGYDPIFFLGDRGCTMADLTAEQKHEVSHRGKVLKAAGDFLESRLVQS